MKKLIHTAAARRASLVRPIITLGIGFLLALFSAALTYSTPPAMEGTFGAGAFFIIQTATPPEQTDGILLMGFVIALIIVVPILWRRKSWMDIR